MLLTKEYASTLLLLLISSSMAAEHLHHTAKGRT